MTEDNLKETLLGIERQGWDSLCNGTAASFYGAVMTEDAVMVLANGMVMDRESVVRSLIDAPPWRSYQIDDPRLVHSGRDSAALVYIGTAHRGSGDPAFVGAMSSVYVREADSWRLALYQQTPVTSRD